MNIRARPEALSLAGGVATPRDKLWLELSAAGNQAFKDGKMDLACQLYTRALREAERLFSAPDAAGTSVPIPAIMNIACHNLAQLWHELGDEAACRHHLILAYDRLVGAARRPSVPLELRVACVRHLKYTFAELTAHLAGQADAEPAIRRYAQRLRDTVDLVSRAAAHFGRAGNDPSNGVGGLAN